MTSSERPFALVFERLKMYSKRLSLVLRPAQCICVCLECLGILFSCSFCGLSKFMSNFKLQQLFRCKKFSFCSRTWKINFRLFSEEFLANKLSLKKRVSPKRSLKSELPSLFFCLTRMLGKLIRSAYEAQIDRPMTHLRLRNLHFETWSNGIFPDSRGSQAECQRCSVLGNMKKYSNYSVDASHGIWQQSNSINFFYSSHF